MLSFFKKKKLPARPVEFTSLVKEGANFVVIFNADTYLSYEILQYCANWNDKFRKFEFYLPAYSCGFFSHTTSFTNAVFHETGTDDQIFERSIILNFNTDPRIRKQLLDHKTSLVIDGANEGNLHFLPNTGDPRKLFQQFCEFFGLERMQKKLQFEFSEKSIRATGYHFFQNRFMNFLLDIHLLDQNSLKQVIISIKQNFPSNIYLNGQLLKKHDFINLKNLPEMTLLDKYLFASNCDLLVSDDYASTRIFHDLNIIQLFIAENEIPAGITSINSGNLHIIKDAIASVLEK